VYPLGMMERAGLGRGRTSFALMLLALGCGRVAENSTPVPPLGGADTMPSVSSTALPPANPSMTPTDPGMVVPPMMTAHQPNVPPRSTKPYWSLCGEIPASPAITVDALFGGNGTLVAKGDDASLTVYNVDTGVLLGHSTNPPFDSWALWWLTANCSALEVLVL